MAISREVRRYEPDVAEFSELQRAFLRRTMLYGAPALLTVLFTFVVFLVAALATAPGWVYFLLAMPAAIGAAFQLVMLWIERPSISTDAVAVEVGEGVLRFVNEASGTVEEVRWREGKSVRVRRRSDSVEITFPSGRRSRVHWFAYTEREQLLKDLMELKKSDIEATPVEARPLEPKAEAEPERTDGEDAATRSGRVVKASQKTRRKEKDEEAK